VTRVILLAVVVAEILDLVTWMAMPRAAEINPLAQGLHSSSAWLLKSALVLLVFALDEVVRIAPPPRAPTSPSSPTAPRLVRHEAPDIPRGTHTLRGIASWVRASLGPRYLAARMPKGTALRVCGPIGCTSGTVNDYGPRKSVFPGRIVDLSRARFAAVCGDPERLGTCPVRVSRLAPLQLPATDR
jgi:hypothetical protein